MSTTNSIKVHISTNCSFCEGKAYIPDGVGETCDSVFYEKHKPCPDCQGTGRISQWITLNQLANLLDQIDPFEVDWAALAEEKEPISQFEDSRESAGL